MADLHAPWDAETVDGLNKYQRLGYLHPFTCPGHDGGGDRDLVATRRGWICCHCDYTQDWAFRSMLDPPPNPVIKLSAPLLDGQGRLAGITAKRE